MKLEVSLEFLTSRRPTLEREARHELKLGALVRVQSPRPHWLLTYQATSPQGFQAPSNPNLTVQRKLRGSECCLAQAPPKRGPETQ